MLRLQQARAIWTVISCKRHSNSLQEQFEIVKRASYIMYEKLSMQSFVHFPQSKRCSTWFLFSILKITAFLASTKGRATKILWFSKECCILVLICCSKYLCTAKTNLENLVNLYLIWETHLKKIWLWAKFFTPALRKKDLIAHKIM